MMRILVLSAVAVVISLHAYSQNWKTFADSAHYFAEKKDNANAIRFFIAAHELLVKDSFNRMSFFTNANETGDLYTAMGQYAKAEPFYSAAIKTIESIEGKQSANYALLCNNLGRLYRLLSQYEKSEVLLIEARKLREQLFGKESPEYAMSCNNLAVLYGEVGQYDDAGPLYIEAKEIRERVLGKDHIDYATSCNNLAIYYIFTGKPYLSEPLYLEAKRIREKVLGKEHPFYAASCNNLGALYLDMGQYKKAEPLYIEARGIRERTLGKQHPDYAASCDNLAILYMDIGQYELAESLYKEAREIRENVLGKKHIDYARGCNNLALLYKLLGQYEKAAALFSEARGIFLATVGRDHFEYGKCCNNLGAVYMDMGDYARAAPLYSEAKEVWSKVLGKDHPEYAKSCHNLALVHLQNNEPDSALLLLNEANAIRKKVFGEDHPDFAEGCDNLATVYLQKNDFQKAIELEMQSKQIRQKILGVAHPDYLQSCINLANIYRSQHDETMAVNLYTEAFSSQQALLNKIFRFTTEPEKQAYLKKVNDYMSYFLSFITDMPSDKRAVYAYEVSLANKNLVLNAAQQLRKVINGSGDSVLIATYNQWINAREQLAFWYSRPVSDRKIPMNQLEEEANSLEKKLIQSSAYFKKEQQESSWKNIQQALSPGEAAVEFSMYRYHNGQRLTDSVNYFAVVIRKDRNSPEIVPLFEKKQLQTLLGGNSNAGPGLQRINYLYKYKNPSPGKNNTSLYSLVWQPLDEKLTGIKTVYFAPAGELYKVAFSALPVSASSLLGDQYRLIQLNTTANIADHYDYKLSPGSVISLYGGVQYDADSVTIRRAVSSYKNENNLAKRSVPDDLLLPGANEFSFLLESEKEVNEIARLARQKNYIVNISRGVDASEESIKSLSQLKGPSVLHIATHGFFFPDPVRIFNSGKAGSDVFRESDNPLIRSGLALAGANNAWRGKPVSGVEDGILTAFEVSNLYLPQTKLAILSACETGLGEVQGSEGVFGLQRAFKMAGVENLVMSLWKVPDMETSEFMQEFYRNMIQQQSVSNAFYAAQRKMKTKYANDPFKWAAWILVR